MVPYCRRYRTLFSFLSRTSDASLVKLGSHADATAELQPARANELPGLRARWAFWAVRDGSAVCESWATPIKPSRYSVVLAVMLQILLPVKAS